MVPRVWKIGDEPGLNLYRNHMGRRHLDVGPGTGHFIVEANPPQDIELTLPDANPNVLELSSSEHCGGKPVADGYDDEHPGGRV